MSYLNTASKNPRLYPAEQNESRSATCKTHNKQRLKKFLEAKPVYNAQGKQVDVEYTCLPDSLCATNNFSTMSLGNVDLSGATAAPKALIDGVAAQEALRAQMTGKGGDKSRDGKDGDAPAQPQQQKRAPARYYDLTAGAGEDRKKICFNCGLQGHERPSCPNKFCFTCHNNMHEGNPCENAEFPSPFALGLSEVVQQEYLEMVKDDLEDVRCLTCGKDGHMDCRKKVAANPLHQDSCSFCATKGHTGLTCPQRMNDRFHLNLQRRFPDLVEPVQAKPGPGGSDNSFNDSYNRSYSGGSGDFGRRGSGGRGGGGGYGGYGGGRGGRGGGNRDDYSLNARQDRVWVGRGGGGGGGDRAPNRYDDRRQDDRYDRRDNRRDDRRDNYSRDDRRYGRDDRGGRDNNNDYGRQKRQRGYDSDEDNSRRRRR